MQTKTLPWLCPHFSAISHPSVEHTGSSFPSTPQSFPNPRGSPPTRVLFFQKPLSLFLNKPDHDIRVVDHFRNFTGALPHPCQNSLPCGCAPKEPLSLPSPPRAPDPPASHAARVFSWVLWRRQRETRANCRERRGLWESSTMWGGEGERTPCAQEGV